MLRTYQAVEIGSAPTRVGLESAFQVIRFPVTADEVDSMLRALKAEIPGAVFRAISVHPELLGRAGPRVIELLGFLSGMIFAAVTRASYSVRVKWFQSIDSSRMSRLLRGFPPAPLAEKVFDEKPPKGMVAAVHEKMFEEQHGIAPAQPGDRRRVWGVISSAFSPAIGSKVSESAAEQSGYCMPQPVKKGKCAQSGAFLAMSSYDAGAQKVGGYDAGATSGYDVRL